MPADDGEPKSDFDFKEFDEQYEEGDQAMPDEVEAPLEKPNSECEHSASKFTAATKANISQDISFELQDEESDSD